MPAKFQIEYDENDLVELILEDLRKKTPGPNFVANDIHVEVKSKQNYKSEWEKAAFRARAANNKEQLDASLERSRRARL